MRHFAISVLSNKTQYADKSVRTQFECETRRSKEGNYTCNGVRSYTYAFDGQCTSLCAYRLLQIIIPLCQNSKVNMCLCAVDKHPPMSNSEVSQASVGEEYAGKSLRRQCECEMCRTGETNHDDDSHDQSLYSQLTLQVRTRYTVLGACYTFWIAIYSECDDCYLLRKKEPAFVSGRFNFDVKQRSYTNGNPHSDSD